MLQAASERKLAFEANLMWDRKVDALERLVLRFTDLSGSRTYELGYIFCRALNLCGS
jgi:hypothetical protein